MLNEVQNIFRSRVFFHRNKKPGSVVLQIALRAKYLENP